MQNIKGFGIIEAYVSNQPGTISLLGELSAWSRTYSKDQGEYLHSDVNGYQFTSFKAIDTTSGSPVVVAQNQVKEILSVIRECVNYATSHIRPYNPLDFKNEVLVGMNGQISNFEFGPFVDNGTIALPGWISWTSLTNSNNQIKVWLADSIFRGEYDEYHIEIVPPIDPIDKFFWAYGLAVGEINKVSASEFMETVQIAKLGHPETFTRITSFDFINAQNPSQKTSTNWAALVYGQQGDNVDSIKDAIVDYVLSNSGYSKAQWQVIFPDMFKRTEFTMLPRWDKIAIPNLTSQSSIYKNMLDPKENLAFAKASIDFYEDDFINNNTLTFPYDYKALNIVSVNGDSNVDEALTLDQLFPDYIPVPSTSADFNRMTEYTRNWVIFLEQLLIVAESVTQHSSVPTTMRKQMRGDVLYVTGIYDNVNYLVCAKSNTNIYPVI